MYQFVHIENFLLEDFSIGIATFLLHYSFAFFFPHRKEKSPQLPGAYTQFQKHETVFSYKIVLSVLGEKKIII